MTIKKDVYRDGRRFSKAIIREVVLRVEQGVSRKQLYAQYGMASVTLDDWMREYGSARYHASKKKSIAPSVKMGAIQSILQGRSTIKEAALQLGIKVDSIRGWLRTFKQENGDLLQTLPSAMKKDKTPTTESEQVKALKKALEEAQLKVAAMETLITVAERELKIDIRKKSGARQSPK